MSFYGGEVEEMICVLYCWEYNDLTAINGPLLGAGTFISFPVLVPTYPVLVHRNICVHYP